MKKETQTITVTVDYTPEECAAINQIYNLALKQVGFDDGGSSAQMIFNLYAKLQQAVNEKDKGNT